jgi:hypothetical protein
MRESEVAPAESGDGLSPAMLSARIVRQEQCASSPPEDELIPQAGGVRKRILGATRCRPETKAPGGGPALMISS